MPDLARSTKVESPINHTRVPGTHVRGNILVAGFGAFANCNITDQHNTPSSFNQHELAYLAAPLEAVALLPFFHSSLYCKQTSVSRSWFWDEKPGNA